jgi:flagellar M-ring protein FliF
VSTLTETAKSLGTAKIATIAAAAAILIGFFIMITFRVSTANMTPLYTELTMQDSGQIVAELEKQGIPYELRAGGSQIAVPADKVLKLRMDMAVLNLPAGGSIVGYEIFDRSETFGSSNFVMNINMMRALEGELSRTINSIRNIESSRVHIVMPKQELFTRDRDMPSASVTLKMRGNTSLQQSEVNAITHLIAAAVPKLNASRVAVIDGNGRLLARGDGDESMSAAASTSEEYRLSYEKRMQHSLLDMIESVIGPGNVQVKVTADINFDRTIINSETYDPEGQVARSTQSNSETENSQDKSASNAVTVANNVPTNKVAGGEGANGNTSTRVIERTDETTNFEISKVVQNKTREGGTVNKLSVAVLVDGNYTTDADGNKTYTPRAEDDLVQLTALIKSAIGFNEARGDSVEVVNMQFTRSDEIRGDASFFDRFKIEMQSIIQTLIIAVVAILAILLVLRPTVMHLIKHTQPPSERVDAELGAIEGGAQVAGALPGTSGGGAMGSMGGGAGSAEDEESDALINVENIKGGMKSSSMRKINEIVDKYPEESMMVLRQWISSTK